MPTETLVSSSVNADTVLVLEALSGIDQALLVVNRNHEVVFVNDRYRDLFDVPSALIQPGAAFHDLQVYLASIGEYGDGDPRDHIAVREEAMREGRNFKLDRKQPDGRYIEVAGNQLPSGGYVFTFSDVTGRVRARENLEALVHRRTQALRDANVELERLATLDPLLGIANRRRLMDAARVLRQRAIEEGSPLAVLMIDVDHFKAINDEHGHAYGDAVLCAIARALQAAVDGDGLVARYGGEEFVVLLPGKTAADAVHIAAQLQQAISAGTTDLAAQLEPADLPATGGACTPALPVAPTVSVGVAEWLAPEPNLEPALNRADAGLYRAKSSGRNQIG
jgi:diguanylate cyclase (GGDEF)-like protein